MVGSAGVSGTPALRQRQHVSVNASGQREPDCPFTEEEHQGLRLHFATSNTGSGGQDRLYPSSCLVRKHGAIMAT